MPRFVAVNAPTGLRRLAAIAALAAALSGCAATGGGASSRAAAGLAVPTQRGPMQPNELMGLSGADVAMALGEPDLKRVEAQAEIWQYGGSLCVLHLFLYPDLDGARVRHAELRARAPGAARCLGGFQRGV